METRDDAPHGDYSADVLKALADVLAHTATERRQVEALGGEATKEQIQTLLSSARDAFAQLYHRYGGQAETMPVQLLGALADGYWQTVGQRKEGAHTGFGDLDACIGGGFQSERLYVLLGGTGSGKTTFANQIGERIANAGRPVFYVTSEDTPNTLLAKTLARFSPDLTYDDFLYGNAEKKPKIDEVLTVVSGRTSATMLAYLHDTGALSLEQMQQQASAYFKKHATGGPGLLVIDYLQRLARMQPGQNGRVDTRELVTLYIMRLRAVAEELGCSVLALSSQGRAGYGNVAEMVATAKESGDIEYTADAVLGLFKEEKKRRNEEGEVAPSPAPPSHEWRGLRIAKNRFGPADKTIWLDWYGQRQMFTKGGWE